MAHIKNISGFRADRLTFVREGNRWRATARLGPMWSVGSFEATVQLAADSAEQALRREHTLPEFAEKHPTCDQFEDLMG